ncbi:MAG TPA: DUF1257 domain-containing protein [Kofleriaceae bacterium]|nr:DUF1257 domain-containing protein [Kofleriaceae bacterium]
MSHFTKCDLKMTNYEALKKALSDMDLQFVEAAEGQSVTVRGYRGQTLDATLCIDMGTYDIGVVKSEDGTYELVADWWGVETTKGVSEEELSTRLKQRYAYHNVLMACEAKGYTVEEEVNQEDGSIQLVVRKWATD